MASRERKLVVGLLSATLVLLAACGFLLVTRAAAPVLNTQAALADPELRQELVSRLARSSRGVWDSHNDPEVGRVMLPYLTDATHMGARTQTNSVGLREKQFTLPKPPGLLRIVLLGDSFVQGFGVEADARVGVFLEEYLRAHATGWTGHLEVLHVGVGGWDAVAECAWLRRALTPLAPDLVLHVLVANDTEDHMGARGFGELASFAPLTWNRTDARVYFAFPSAFATPQTTNFMLKGADYESRHRYERMADAIGRLVAPLRRSGIPYVTVAHWGYDNPRVWRVLEGVLRPEEFAALPRRLYDPEVTLSPSDQHWNRLGHETVARWLFTLIRSNGLLPALSLSPWPEVEEPARAELAAARMALNVPDWYWLPPKEGVSSLEPARFTENEWRHVYTGLDGESQVSPFASFYLAHRGQTELALRGRGLERPEIAGARLRVLVEGIEVGQHELVPGEPFELRFPLPAGLPREGGITVQLETSDYCYTGKELQHCISFLLDRLALE